ncbi:MAG: YggT family protein [Chloroflexi bacterium]|nr:YggT family protein [Chloroflexota bacterium]
MSAVALVNAVISLLYFAILGRVILSWVMVAGIRNDFVIRLNNALVAITEPLLGPLRRVLPTMGMMDITPMVAIFILIIVQQVLLALL